VRAIRITTRNASFQQWQALLHNRTKRQRQREFLVQGVRPIDQAVAHGWTVRALLHAGDSHSNWAQGLLRSGVAERQVQLAPELLHELSEKEDSPPELIAVVEIPPDSLTRIPLKRHGLLVVFDRPTSPGNLGSLIRSGDALGVDGVIVTGHATDVYDPKAVRASRGSLFAVPTVRAESPADVVSWLRERSDGPFTIVGTSETGTHELWEHDFAHPTAVVVGNETSGMSSFWSQQCDAVVRIPMTGSASSLNATVAASITLYEVARQRQQHAEPTRVG
jgi:tRNA G18 (ribose-2'-O)-methylase SpoU